MMKTMKQVKVGDDELPDQQEARRRVQQGSVLGPMFFRFVFVLFWFVLFINIVIIIVIIDFLKKCLIATNQNCMYN